MEVDKVADMVAYMEVDKGRQKNHNVNNWPTWIWRGKPNADEGGGG